MSPQKIAPHNTKIYIIGQVLHSLVFTIPIWIVFLQEKLPPEQISFLIGWQFVMQVVSELPTGAFADLFGRKVSAIIGFVLTALAWPLAPFAQDFSHFLLIASCAGIADSFLSGSIEALMYDSFKQDGAEDRYQEAVSTQNFWYQIGLVTATAAGGFLYYLHHSLPFFLHGSLMVSGAVLSWFFIEPKVDTERFTLKSYVSQMKIGAQEAFKTSHLRTISLFFIVVGGITWACALYFNSYMMVALGFSDQDRGLIEAGLRLINILVLMRLLKNKKIFTKTISILFFPISMTLSLLPGILLNGFFALPFIAGSMAASTARWIILSRYTNEQFSSKYRATAISMLSMLVGVMAAALAMGSGPIIAQWGVRYVYTGLGVMTLALVLPLGLRLVYDSKITQTKG